LLDICTFFFEATIPHDSKNNTEFIALDKAVERRPWLEVVDFPNETEDAVLSYDPEWLGILRATSSFISFSDSNMKLPKSFEREKVLKEVQWVKENIPKEKLVVPFNFIRTDKEFKGENPQTTEFLKLVGLPTPFPEKGHSQSSSKRKY